jgi:hypothetical protein
MGVVLVSHINEKKNIDSGCFIRVGGLNRIFGPKKRGNNRNIEAHNEIKEDSLGGACNIHSEMRNEYIILVA